MRRVGQFRGLDCGVEKNKKDCGRDQKMWKSKQLKYLLGVCEGMGV